MNVKEKLQALLTASNATTGETDTTLTDAVQSLIDGYGGGGFPAELITAYTTGSVTVPTLMDNVTIVHGLGDTPDFIVYFVDPVKNQETARATIGCYSSVALSNTQSGLGLYTADYGNTINKENFGGSLYLQNVNNISFDCAKAGNAYYFAGGSEIHWIAIKTSLRDLG